MNTDSYAVELGSILRLSLSQEYNDNLYLDPDHEEDDFITIITPGIQSSLNWQRSELSCAYDIGYSKYNAHSENDSFRHRGDIGWWWDIFQNTRLSINDTYIKSEDIADLPDQETDTNRREGYYSNNSRLNLTQRFGENRHFSVGYAYNFINYKDAESEDNQSHNASFDSTFYLNPHTGFQTHVTYTKGLYEVTSDFDETNGSLRLIHDVSRRVQINVAYDHSIMNWEEDQGADHNYQIYNPSAGIRYSFGDDGETAVNVGYFVQDIDSQQNENGLTVNGNVGRSWRFRQGNIQLTGNSGYENSQLNSDNLGFNVFYGAEFLLNYQIERNVSSTLHASYRHNDYVNSSPDDSDRADKIIASGCSLNWQFLRWLTIRFDYNFRKLDSNRDENDYIENRVLVSLNFVSQFGRTSNDQ